MWRDIHDLDSRLGNIRVLPLASCFHLQQTSTTQPASQRLSFFKNTNAIRINEHTILINDHGDD